MQKIIKKADLIKLLETWLKEFQVIGPKELPHKGIFYQEITDARELYPGEKYAIEPAKKFFLSPYDDLFEEGYKEKEISLVDAPQPKKKRIFIGLRPCEARGLELLDRLFDDAKYKDNFYIANRKRTMIVGLGCTKPAKSCFCTSMGGLPTETRGMDALIRGGPDSFFIEIITGKGRDIFGSAGKDLDQGEEENISSDKKKVESLLEKKIKVPQDLEKSYFSDYWENASRPCLSCGVCTFLCPTCHCFDIVDEERKRLRCYDGCAFADFTLEASGGNPRPTKKERYRQRVFHKFHYFKKNFGENLCVGCGRCIRHCPVKIDIAEIAEKAPC